MASAETVVILTGVYLYIMECKTTVWEDSVRNAYKTLGIPITPEDHISPPHSEMQGKLTSICQTLVRVEHALFTDWYVKSHQTLPLDPIIKELENILALVRELDCV